MRAHTRRACVSKGPYYAPMTSKAELLAALHASAEELTAGVRATPKERLDEGRYENGWTARQILAHVAAIEWTYPKLIEVARGVWAGRTEGLGGDGLSQRPIQGGMDGYNARQVEKRAGATVDELVAEFRANRETFIAAIEACDDALLAVEIRSSGGHPGPLAEVLYTVSVQHVRDHARDIRGPMQ